VRGDEQLDARADIFALGCGTATMRLHTGDRVRVDGEHSTVELLEVAAAA
jgi:hypothetical protein